MKNKLFISFFLMNFFSGDILSQDNDLGIISGNVQAIVVGNGEKKGEIKYIKNDLINKIDDKGIAYTSGTGSIFKSGITVGTIDFKDENGKMLINLNLKGF